MVAAPGRFTCVEEVLERARRLVERHEEEARRLLPDGATIFDAHVHVGRDIDGMVAPLDDLSAFLERWGVERAFAFCMDEPDREPAFRAANDRTLAAAERSNGLLVPFVRLDLAAGPIEEATRALDAGARGIKLHPRAQGFLLDDQRLEPVFALASERRVPILIHGGRGLPPIADSLARLLDRHAPPALIVAHAGIVDLAAMARNFAGRPGVYFDTSVWSPLDLLDLYRLVPPEQVVYASDYPYGRQPNSLLMAIRTAKLVGFDDRQLRGLLGENARRIADGEPASELTSPRGGGSLVQPLTFARIHQYISMAVPLLWLRQRDAIGAIGLAVNASRERSNGHPEASERIEELLATAQDLWRSCAEIEDDRERVSTFRAALQLVNLADMVSLTTRA